MKKTLLLTLVMVLGASLAMAQPGAVGLFADAGGTNCNISTLTPGLLSVYAVHVLTGGSTAVQFASPLPPCMIDPFLSWAAAYPTNIGNPVTPAPAGVSVAYGACLAGSVLVGTLSFFAQGLTPPCCLYPVIPHQGDGLLAAADCTQPFPIKLPATGLIAVINANATCDCQAVPTRNATWGAVKSLYN